MFICLLNNRDFLTKTNFRGYKIIVSRVEITKQASATQPRLAFKVHHLGFPYVPIIKMCAMLLLLQTPQWERVFLPKNLLFFPAGMKKQEYLTKICCENPQDQFLYVKFSIT